MLDYQPGPSHAFTAATSTEGIRGYIKSSDGLVRELCYNVSPEEYRDATLSMDWSIINLERDWFLGALMFRCHEASKLACYIDTQWRKSIFYQDADGCIRERRHDGSPDASSWKWHPTAFQQTGALLGTSLLILCGKEGPLEMLFFQDNEGYICYRFAVNRKWAKAARLPEVPRARMGSGIAAAASPRLLIIKLFYQTDSNLLCQCLITVQNGPKFRDINWTYVQEKPFDTLIREIAVTARPYGDKDTRLYVQDETDDIAEFHIWHGRRHWRRRKDLNLRTSPGACLSATRRDDGFGADIQLRWVAQDGIVRQTGQPLSRWLTPLDIYQARPASELSEYLVGGGSAADTHAQSPLVDDVVGDVSNDSSTIVAAFPMDTEMIRVESCPATADDLVALRAGEHIFQIRRKILCQTSALFNDVLAIPQPLDAQSEEVHEGCALVPVQESAEDVKLFLRVCQDGSILQSASGHDYAVLLRVALKYQAWALCSRLIAVIEHEYPTSLAGFLHTVNAHPTVDRSATQSCVLFGSYRQSPRFSSLRASVAMYGVAVRERLDFLLPSILLQCSIHPADALTATIVALGLDNEERTALLEYQRAFIGFYSTVHAKLMEASSLPCASPANCGLADLDAAKLVFMPPYALSRASRLCASCSSNVWEAHAPYDQVTDDAWDMLPGIFGLEPWEVLEKHRSGFWEDVRTRGFA